MTNDSQTCDLWTYEMMNPAGTHAMNQETKKLITIH